MAQLEVVTKDAYARIAEFVKGFPEAARTRDWWITRMRHWWDDNPAMSAEFERGFMIMHADRVVGFLGVIPRMVDTADGIRLSANTSTWRVLPEHRKLSLALLARMLTSKVYAHFNTTPADGVVPIMKSFKFVPFPGLNRHHESLLVLDPGAVAAVALKRRVPATSCMTGILSHALRPAARLGLAVARRGRSPKAVFPGRILESAGKEVDALWQRSRLRGLLTAARTSADVNWYAFGNPTMPKLLVGCFDGSELVGFALLCQRENRDLKLYDCADIFMREESAEIVESLVAAAAAAARPLNAAFVAFRHFTPFLAGCYRELGLIERIGEEGRELMRLDGIGSANATPSYLTQMHGDRWL